ncbi:MAG: hypothetical protein NZ900_03580 [Synergistetes bacterium]|nr:hypothetical protein [Synergistota bacterium]MDW8192012.1 hypothetical protein [Synergistota bacterium]
MKEGIFFCQECLKKVISELEREYTTQKMGKALCWDCLKKLIVLEELKKKEEKEDVIKESIEKLREENIKVKLIEDLYGGKEGKK